MSIMMRLRRDGNIAAEVIELSHLPCVSSQGDNKEEYVVALKNGFFIVGISILMVGMFETMMGAEAPPAPPAAAQSATAATATDTYVGTAKCKMCHMAQFRQYNAFVTDTAQAVHMNLKAGVTADSKAVGHCDAGAIVVHARKDLQCETCHGMGSRHFALGAANRDTAARKATINLGSGSSCRACHSPHVLK